MRAGRSSRPARTLEQCKALLLIGEARLQGDKAEWVASGFHDHNIRESRTKSNSSGLDYLIEKSLARLEGQRVVSPVISSAPCGSAIWTTRLPNSQPRPALRTPPRRRRTRWRHLSAGDRVGIRSVVLGRGWPTVGARQRGPGTSHSHCVIGCRTTALSPTSCGYNATACPTVSPPCCARQCCGGGSTAYAAGTRVAASDGQATIS